MGRSIVYMVFSTLRTFFVHDDAIKWKHFPRYWPFVWGIHRSPVNSPHKGQWHGALVLSFICAWMNSWVNNHEAGDLRRYRAHYDFTICTYTQIDYVCMTWHTIPAYCQFEWLVPASMWQSMIISQWQTRIMKFLMCALPLSLWLKTHQTPKTKCFSSRLAVVFAQYIEASC